LPSLKELNLGENPINCNCLMSWAQEWTDPAKNIEGKIVRVF